MTSQCHITTIWSTFTGDKSTSSNPNMKQFMGAGILSFTFSFSFTKCNNMLCASGPIHLRWPFTSSGIPSHRYVSECDRSSDLQTQFSVFISFFIYANTSYRTGLLYHMFSHIPSSLSPSQFPARSLFSDSFEVGSMGSFFVECWKNEWFPQLHLPVSSTFGDTAF